MSKDNLPNIGDVKFWVVFRVWDAGFSASYNHEPPIPKGKILAVFLTEEPAREYEKAMHYCNRKCEVAEVSLADSFAALEEIRAEEEVERIENGKRKAKEQAHKDYLLELGRKAWAKTNEEG